MGPPPPPMRIMSHAARLDQLWTAKPAAAGQASTVRQHRRNDSHERSPLPADWTTVHGGLQARAEARGRDGIDTSAASPSCASCCPASGTAPPSPEGQSGAAFSGDVPCTMSMMEVLGAHAQHGAQSTPAAAKPLAPPSLRVPDVVPTARTAPPPSLPPRPPLLRPVDSWSASDSEPCSPGSPSITPRSPASPCVGRRAGRLLADSLQADKGPPPPPMRIMSHPARLDQLWMGEAAMSLAAAAGQASTVRQHRRNDSRERSPLPADWTAVHGGLQALPEARGCVEPAASLHTSLHSASMTVPPPPPSHPPPPKNRRLPPPPAVLRGVEGYVGIVEPLSPGTPGSPGTPTGELSRERELSREATRELQAPVAPLSAVHAAAAPTITSQLKG